MTITTHRLTFPLSAADARTLRAGDQVVIDGEIVISAGLPTYQRLVGCLDGHEAPPMDLRGLSVFHIGSFSRDVTDPSGDARFELLYLNPTTSTRFNPLMPRLIRGFQWHAVGGKGGLDEASVAALQEVGGVYLSFLGGGCTLLSQAIEEVLDVGWSDMLVHYRVVRLRVKGLGPATVGIDAHGRSLYAEEQQQAAQRLPALLAQLDAARRAAPPSEPEPR